ncbi:MAG: hypothetical protein WDW38_011581 [Sanguina aurantia]
MEIDDSILLPARCVSKEGISTGMLFAARPGPKKLVGGKLTKDAAAALFEKYYGPDAVMEQILGGKRQLEPRSTATDASTRHRVVSTSSEVARPTAEESRLMEAAADEEVEGDITSRAKKETRSKNLPLGMQRKFAGNPFSNGSSKTKLTNIALLAGGAGKAAGGSSSPQPETASPLDYGGAVVVARAAAHVRAPQPGAARPAVRVQASSAGTLMDDGCRTSGQAAIAQLRGARKAVEMQPESKGVEVTDASTMPGAARAMHRLAADDGRSAIYMRAGSASFRGVTRDQAQRTGSKFVEDGCRDSPGPCKYTPRYGALDRNQTSTFMPPLHSSSPSHLTFSTAPTLPIDNAPSSPSLTGGSSILLQNAAPSLSGTASAPSSPHPPATTPLPSRRPQSAAALTRSGSMSANAQQNVGGLAPPAGESIAGSRLGVGSMSRAGRHPNKSTSTRSTSGTGGGMDDGMNGWADGGDANQQLHQRGDDLYAGAHRVHARPSSAPGSSAFKAVPRPQLLADTTGSHLALKYFREGYDDMTRRATRHFSVPFQRQTPRKDIITQLDNSAALGPGAYLHEHIPTSYTGSHVAANHQNLPHTSAFSKRTSRPGSAPPKMRQGLPLVSLTAYSPSPSPTTPPTLSTSNSSASITCNSMKLNSRTHAAPSTLRPIFNFCQSHSRSGSRPSSGHRSGRPSSASCRREAEDKAFAIQDDEGELGFDMEWQKLEGMSQLDEEAVKKFSSTGFAKKVPGGLFSTTTRSQSHNLPLCCRLVYYGCWLMDVSSHLPVS